jgi:hypothetical protein
VARGHVGSWDPVFFALLLVNSALMATTALLLLGIASRVIGEGALVAPLLLLLNFATPTYYLAGLVDSIELLGVTLFTTLLLRRAWGWLVPVMAVVVTGKETFLPLGSSFALGWLALSWSDDVHPRRSAGWVAALALAGVLSLTVLGAATGAGVGWLFTGAAVRLVPSDIAANVRALASDHALWYVFGWLLPLAVPALARTPGPWRAATLAGAAAAVALGVLSDEPSVNRALFNVSAPLLCVAAADTLTRFRSTASRQSSPTSPSHPEVPADC